MINPHYATTVARLIEWIEGETGTKCVVGKAVEPYLALFLAAGLVTSASGDGAVGEQSCNGIGDGRPWILVDGDHEADEIMALLKAARLDDGVQITKWSTYDLEDEITWVEKLVTFPKPHPASV